MKWALSGCPGSGFVDLNLNYTQILSSLALRHKLAAKNLTNTEVLFPEYVRRNINAIPWGNQRQIIYTLQITGMH